MSSTRMPDNALLPFGGGTIRAAARADSRAAAFAVGLRFAAVLAGVFFRVCRFTFFFAAIAFPLQSSPGFDAAHALPPRGGGVDRPLPAAPPRERPTCTSSGWRYRAPRPPDRSRR